MELVKVGVIGAGVMGRGVAQNLLQSGFEVYLIDSLEEQLESAQNAIKESVRIRQLFNKGVIDNPVILLDRLHIGTDIDLLKETDLVIENITEDWALKKDLYKQIDYICKDDCIFVVNTSAISITKVASQTRRPDRVIGVHFMNPVPLKSTVELIRGHHTSDETLDRTQKFLATLDKKFIIVNDMPGFVSNRVLMLTINEAIFLLQDQVASAEDIDRVFCECFGHKMGPLETADLIGLDTILKSVEVLFDSYKDPKYRPCSLLVKMVDAGLYGKKTGKGFYKYFNKTY